MADNKADNEAKWVTAASCDLIRADVKFIIENATRVLFRTGMDSDSVWSLLDHCHSSVRKEFASMAKKEAATPSNSNNNAANGEMAGLVNLDGNSEREKTIRTLRFIASLIEAWLARKPVPNPDDERAKVVDPVSHLVATAAQAVKDFLERNKLRIDPDRRVITPIR